MADREPSPLNPGFFPDGAPQTVRQSAPMKLPPGATSAPVARHLVANIANGAKNLWGALVQAATSPRLTEAGGIPGTPNPPYGPGQTLNQGPANVVVPSHQAQPGMITSGRPSLAEWRQPLMQRREPWFGPGQPMRPVAPSGDVAGRAFDYENQRNTRTTPRGGEKVSFTHLRAIADTDMVRLAIETRKDQMGKLEFSILPKKKQRSDLRGEATPRCVEIERFLQRPDRIHDWGTWLRLLLEDHFVIDAPSLYVRRTMSGAPYSIEVIDGTTIIPLIDVMGRQPMPPEPAYQQILRGMPAINYAANELIYLPRNPRPGKIYGYSPCEQIVMTVNIALRRELAKLAYYTEGNVPEALVSVPKDWTPQQISEFQIMWDALMSDTGNRRKMKFVPGEMAVQFTRDNASLMDQYDEWLARVICYAFSLPALPFIKMQNRATAETAYETAIEEGLQPMMQWAKGLMDRVVQDVFGDADLEFVWDDIEKLSKQERDAANFQKIDRGIIGIDEVRAEEGKPPLGMGPAIRGLGPHGIMFVKDIVEAQKAGLLKIQPPPDPMAMFGGGGMVGDPQYIDGEVFPEEEAMPPGAPQALPAPTAGGEQSIDDILAGVDPRLLAAVGLGPQGAQGRAVDVTAQEEAEDDPLTPHAAHPDVINALRSFERAHRAA